MQQQSKDSWVYKSKKKQAMYRYGIAVLVIAALTVFVIRNNLISKSQVLLHGGFGRNISAGTGHGNVPRDGMLSASDSAASDETAVRKEYLYSYKLSRCSATPSDEKHLNIYMVLDLQYSTAELQKEIMEREKDLRVLVSLVVSSRKLSEIEVSRLRPEVMDKLNSILTKGKIQDVRFIDFRIERI